MELTALVGGIQRFSTSDGPGIRTSVFLKGCPLSCRWCHNPELINRDNQLMFSKQKCVGCMNCKEVCPVDAISFTEEGIAVDREKCTSCFLCSDGCYAESLRTAAKEMSVSEIMTEVLKDRGYYEETGGGLTISGGECMSSPKMTSALVDAARSEGISVTLDTSGFCNTDDLMRLAPLVDYILYDMKGFDNEVHKEYTGVSNEIILKNLALLGENEDLRAKVWIRMPLISGVNDTPEIIEATRDFLGKYGFKKATLLPYHELGVAKYRSLGVQQQVFEPPTQERLEEIAAEFAKVGVNAEILGVTA